MANFYETLTEAIREITRTGFQSQTQIDGWLEKIRTAARASLISEDDLALLLRQRLGTIYDRLVTNGGIRRYVVAERFTIGQVEPHLRAELDRRIAASADLIRLNRGKRIEETLQRFQGWATSVPVGGSDAVDRVRTATGIRKALRQLPFEERRVIIDQGHKLTSSLAQILAANTGAIAAEWHSNWRQVGYNYREDHKERDLGIFLIKGTWATEKGYAKPGESGWWDEITKPAEEPFCRCHARFIFALSDLPEDMITAAGRAEMARVREIVAGRLAAS